MSSRSIDPKLLEVNLRGEEKEEWSTKLITTGMAQGTRYTYDVIDHNFKTNNKWEVLVRVPGKQYALAGVEIRLEKDGCPAREAVKTHSIWRESIVFNPTSVGFHRDRWYVKVRVKARKMTTKKLVKRGGRSEMPEWLQLSYFSKWMRLKGTVKTSNSGDLEQQILLAKPDDHLRMIRTFFALRVWSVL